MSRQPFPLLLLTLSVLLGAASAQAQNVLFRAGGGLATLQSDTKSVGAYKVGVGYEIEFDQHWTLTPGLYLYGKGWKMPDTPVQETDSNDEPLFDEETGRPIMGVMTSSTSANYLQLPFMLSYYFRLDPSAYLVVSAGPYVALGLFGKQTTRGDTSHPGARKLYYDRATFGSAGVRRFEAGLEAFVGYQSPKGLMIGIESDLGLTRVVRGGARSLSGLLVLAYKL